MLYIRIEDYTKLYGDIDSGVFDRLAFDACRQLDRLTTGIDGVKKLKLAMPADDDRTAVVQCACKIVNMLYQIEEAEKSASLSRGYVDTEEGLRGKIISSATAGNVSVSYSTGAAKTAADIAATDREERKKMINETIRDYLSGVADANGVNLLYMGVYPNV